MNSLTYKFQEYVLCLDKLEATKERNPTARRCYTCVLQPHTCCRWRCSDCSRNGAVADGLRYSLRLTGLDEQLVSRPLNWSHLSVTD
jgi:hypothetical protein